MLNNMLNNQYNNIKMRKRYDRSVKLFFLKAFMPPTEVVFTEIHQINSRFYII